MIGRWMRAGAKLQWEWPRWRAVLFEWKLGQFGAAVGGAVIGGLMSFAASSWQADRKDAQERQAAACIIGGELQVVHLALLSAVQSGRGAPEQTLGALESLRLRNINPSANTWGLAVKLEPPLAREVSQFRASLTGVLNSLSFASTHPVDALSYAEKMLGTFTDMAGVSGSFTKQLQVICERGGGYIPSKDERTFTLDFGKVN